MSPSKGNPTLQIRLEPNLHEKLRETAGESSAGKSAGATLFVRRLIHRELNEELPSDPLADLHELAKQIDTPHLWMPEQAKELEEVFCLLGDAIAEKGDLIRRTYAEQILGRLAIRMFNESRLEFRDPSKS